MYCYRWSVAVPPLASNLPPTQVCKNSLSRRGQNESKFLLHPAVGSPRHAGQRCCAPRARAFDRSDWHRRSAPARVLLRAISTRGPALCNWMCSRWAPRMCFRAGGSPGPSCRVGGRTTGAYKPSGKWLLLFTKSSGARHSDLAGAEWGGCGEISCQRSPPLPHPSPRQRCLAGSPLSLCALLVGTTRGAADGDARCDGEHFGCFATSSG